MPNIRGTNGNDNIDVSNDNGTLNGSPEGSPINNIRARRGDDTISVSDSTISGDIRAGNGNDDVNITDSTVGGIINAGAGSDTVVITGSDVGNINLGGGNDSLEILGTTTTVAFQGGGGTDSLNLPAGTIVTDSTHGTFTVTDGGSYSLSSGSFELPSGNIYTYSQFESGTGIPCFVRGTRIQTAHGETKIEDLKVGDMVQTRDNGLCPVRWIASRRLGDEELNDAPKLRPIRIMAGALGNGLPVQDLLVSRQHRMFVSSKITQRMFGCADVLIPSIKLTELPGIFIDDSATEVEYFHLLFDRHEIVYAEAAPTESLYTGPEALNALGHEQRIEILTLFPEIAELNYEPVPARLIPPGKQQKQLISRHLKNNKPLLHSEAQFASA